MPARMQLYEIYTTFRTDLIRNIRLFNIIQVWNVQTVCYNGVT